MNVPSIPSGVRAAANALSHMRVEVMPMQPTRTLMDLTILEYGKSTP